MAHRFEDLCAQLCEIAGVPVPQLSEDEGGITAFTLEVDGFPTSVLQRRERSDAITVVCSLGAAAQKDDALACRSLMEANFLMLGDPQRLCAGRNPVTGEYTLSYTEKLEAVSVHELYHIIFRMGDIAQRWNGGQILADH